MKLNTVTQMRENYPVHPMTYMEKALTLYASYYAVQHGLPHFPSDIIAGYHFSPRYGAIFNFYSAFKT